MSNHLTEADMVERGEDIALFSDLEGADDATLAEIMSLCDEEGDDLDPAVCVPCRAFTILNEREALANAEAARAGHGETLDVATTRDLSIAPERVEGSAQADIMAEHTSDVQPPPHVASLFAAKVDELQLLVQQMLQGPPIPPKNVTLQELATLVFAARKWSAMLDSQVAQGFALSDEQKSLKETVDYVTDRLGSA